MAKTQRPVLRVSFTHKRHRRTNSFLPRRELPQRLLERVHVVGVREPPVLLQEDTAALAHLGRDTMEPDGSQDQRPPPVQTRGERPGEKSNNSSDCDDDTLE